MLFNDVFRDRKVLVTGHTGFKGSWLVLWLEQLGARVTCLALPPATDPNHWTLLALDQPSLHVDVRDEALLRQTVTQTQPEVVFHLAAQSLVRRSYHEPLATWSTNVQGTANLLDACREARHLAAIVVVTTDKCYENREWVWGYRETDALGGHDPYSASKAGTELVAGSFRRSFFDTHNSALLATARAGNVVGGGDWSEDRLIPDLVRSLTAGQPLVIRSPGATRPWQHVLECLSGYLLLAQHLLEGKRFAATAWNFGPERDGNRQVQQVLSALKTTWPALEYRFEPSPQQHEAQLLHLDSSKARAELGWRPVWSFDEGLIATAAWYRDWLQTGAIGSRSQLQQYIDNARTRGLCWAAGKAACN